MDDRYDEIDVKIAETKDIVVEAKLKALREKWEKEDEKEEGCELTDYLDWILAVWMVIAIIFWVWIIL